MSSNLWDKFGRRFKYFLSIILLIKELLKNKNQIVFSFQANIYCIIICKFFGTKSNFKIKLCSLWLVQKLDKNKIFKIFLNSANKIMVNSEQFKKI